MGIFDKFKNAETMGTRQYIEEGIHIFEIRRVEQGMSKNPKSRGVEKTVVEFAVAESDSMKAGISCSLVEMETLQGQLSTLYRRSMSMRHRPHLT